MYAKFRKNFLTISTIFLPCFILFFVLNNVPIKNTPDSTPEEIAQSSNVEKIERLELNDPYQSPESAVNKYIELMNEKNQSDFVRSLFGHEAWDKASYELIKRKSPETKSQWVETSTGKVITEEEGTRLSKQYWSNVAELEGVQLDTIFPGPDADERTAAKSHSLQQKYLPGIPVELRQVDLYEAYEVHLTFDEKNTAPTGEHKFRIDLTNKDGKWSVFYGLSWEPPLTEPESEV